MLPSAFVLLDALPLTPNDKVDRKALPVPDQRGAEAQITDPRYGTEQQLAALWMQLLGISQVGIHDNFFALGGHSLLAVRLISAIRQQFGHQLPLATLFTNPTIAQLAREVHRTSARSSSPLVPIQPHGHRAPFFFIFIHAAGGSVFSFYALARLLGPDQPCYGLQSVGLDGISDPQTTIESMAECYADQIRTVQPSGPYWIGGYSLGGTIAYAVAQVLRRDGYTVARVIILDTPAPATVQSGNWLDWSEADWLIDVITMIEEQMFKTGAPVAVALAHDPDWLSQPPAIQLRQANQHLHQAYLDAWDASDDILRGFVRVYQANLYASVSYQPHAGVPVPITLVRTLPLKESEQEDVDPTWGWTALADGDIDLHWVAGEHLSLLDELHIREVATAINQALDL